MIKPFRTIHIHGKIDVEVTDRRTIVATDASLWAERDGVALAYVTSHGHYGLSAHPYPQVISGQDRITTCELRAILLSLEHVFDDASREPVRVLTDNQAALEYIAHWRTGGDRMPANYGNWLRSTGTQPSLVALSRKVRRHQVISFRKVAAHSGHPLNETADSLAKLGLRHGRRQIDGDDVRRLAPLWAARGHDDYVKSLAASERGST